MTPVLNWKEIRLAVGAFSPEVESMFVDKIVVPSRPVFPGGYIKNEWAIRLTSRRQERVLLFSLRVRQPYFALCKGKGPKAASEATHSPFDQAISKFLRGAKLLRVEALPRERVVVIWFSGEGTAQKEIGLVLTLIPASPVGLLVRKTSAVLWEVIASSKTPKKGEALAGTYSPPDGSKAPEELAIRAELFGDPWTFFQQIEEGLSQEALEVRVRVLERGLKNLLKQARDRIRQSEVSLKEAQGEAEWQKYGDLLKSCLHDLPAVVKGERVVEDFETRAKVRIPCDPKLGPQAQVEKFYQAAKRRNRRIEEAQSRIETFSETREKLEAILAGLIGVSDLQTLEKLERESERLMGGGRSGSPAAAETSRGKKSLGGAWLGKSFVSRDGFAIWVGRSRDENLELTFKHARGNDLWMHLRGRPGAHIVIPIQPGKSVPLETLLDAAALTVFYSGGEKWGKTEVDYTFKKYVKRIKDSKEASYTNNKTLLVEPDPTRLKRLLGS